MKRLLAALIVPIVLLSGGTPEAQEKVWFGTGSAISLTTAPLTMAMGMGFFKEEGLDVQLVTFVSGAEVIPPFYNLYKSLRPRLATAKAQSSHTNRAGVPPGRCSCKTHVFHKSARQWLRL